MKNSIVRMIQMITIIIVVSSVMVSAQTRTKEEGLAKVRAAIAKQRGDTVIPLASEVFEKILDDVESKKIPLEIYPPGYLDWLSKKGDEPLYEMMRFDPGASALTAGDKANMSWIDPGTFVMGSPTSEAQRNPDEAQHIVTITSGFYIGKYPVTQGEYLAIMGNNPSEYSTNFGHDFDLNLPVERVSWHDATNYCGVLTQQELLAGRIQSGWAYRLPTEAEWEYSCRAGTTTAFSFGNAIHGGDANFETHYEYDSSSGTTFVSAPAVTYLFKTSTVGNYDPNAWGLYDMHGNVANWCSDWYSIYPSGSVVDPQGPATGTYRVARSTPFYNGGAACRSAWRLGGLVPESVGIIGFRVVLAPTTAQWRALMTTETSRHNLPDIGSPPPGKDSLVLITHGRITGDPGVSTAWVDSMADSIDSYLVTHSINNWHVRGHKWIGGASANVLEVLENAKQQGVNLGHQILAQGYTSVHFIAHSAGAGLIQSATDVIKASNSSVMIHETFLDPYVGPLSSDAKVYGNGADWAENYFTRDKEDTDILGSLFPFTDFIMPHTYNVDVTQLDVNNREQRDRFITGSGTPCYVTKSKHDWPINFYSNTITGTVTSDYHDYGFPLSKVGGNYSYAIANYFAGNGRFGNPVALKQLGPLDPNCFLDIPAPTYPSSVLDLFSSPSVQSMTGIISKYPNGSIKKATGSPVWLATFITVSNVANVISFEADFQSPNNAAEGLLSVYWDNQNIGSVDERVVQDGFRNYTFKLPLATSNSMHMLGFRLDPFTNIQSVIVITNVITTASGVTQPFSLAITGVTNGLMYYQLTGQAGFEYSVQATTNLVNWMTIASLINTNGTVQFYDKDSTNYTYRFYRAVAPF